MSIGFSKKKETEEIDSAEEIFQTKELRKMKKTELLEISDKYGDDRLTEIQDVENEIDLEDLIVEEDVDTLCGKCDDFAYEWAPVAEEIWNSTPHPKTHTQYYRDGGKARIQ